MHIENQLVEWKESWHFDHFKWICGFANAQGGSLFIGLNDEGKPKHLDKAKKLLGDIPNQARDLLGIVVDVFLREVETRVFLEVKVEPYPFPVNLRGRYYYRSGSTLQELKGAALSKFLMERQGLHWDGVPFPAVSIEALKVETITLFSRMARKCGRLSLLDLKLTQHELIDSLNLVSGDGKTLKRAAILLFYHNPTKYIPGAYVKIGFFEGEDVLVFHDEVRGNLFEQAERAYNLIITKYFHAAVSYQGAARIERYPFPLDALREALFNALVHKDYSGGTPVQISISPDKLVIYNEGELPKNWTVEKLQQKHPSKPFNPEIANAFFRAGYIESWGRGTIRIINACREYGMTPPIFSADGTDFEVQLIRLTDAFLSNRGVNKQHRQIILYLQDRRQITNSEVQQLCSVSKATASRYLAELEQSYLDKVGSTGKGTYYVLKGS